MKPTPFLFLLLAGWPLAGRAQTRPAADSLRARGELTGARPSGKRLARPRAQPTPARAAAADLAQQRLLDTDVKLEQARADDLPDLYEQFIATTRNERRQWSYADWDAAGEVLARLNQRYEQVRTGLPLEERLRIRTFQGEFRTLRAGRKVKDNLD